MIEVKIERILGVLASRHYMFCSWCEMFLDLGIGARELAVERANELGWMYTTDGWTCPECLEKQEEKDG